MKKLPQEFWGKWMTMIVFYHNIHIKENFFQSVTKSVTQRKSKRCLELSHKLIGLFPKMNISDWLLHEKATSRILNRVKWLSVKYWTFIHDNTTAAGQLLQIFKHNYKDFAAKHTHWHLQWFSDERSHLWRPKHWSLRPSMKLNLKLVSLKLNCWTCFFTN